MQPFPACTMRSPGLRIHGRKAVAQLQHISIATGSQWHHVSMAERPWHNCSYLLRLCRELSRCWYPWPKGRGTIAEQPNQRPPLMLLPLYPWPKGRGTIAAGLRGNAKRYSGRYPWPKGRGTIAAPHFPLVPIRLVWYPWPKGRGTIAAGCRQANRVSHNLVSMAERPWHNCSQFGYVRPDEPRAVSMAERPWHNCSVQPAKDALLESLVSMAERPWHNCSAQIGHQRLPQ